LVIQKVRITFFSLSIIFLPDDGAKWSGLDWQTGMASRRQPRRDRLWLIAAFAVMLLTLLGAAGETLGYDRFLKSNTAKRRTHSLLRQGCMLYELIPTMPEPRLLPLVQKFADMLAAPPVFAETFGAV
jgi:hypothetical protein